MNKNYFQIKIIHKIFSFIEKFLIVKNDIFVVFIFKVLVI